MAVTIFVCFFFPKTRALLPDATDANTLNCRQAETTGKQTCALLQALYCRLFTKAPVKSAVYGKKTCALLQAYIIAGFILQTLLVLYERGRTVLEEKHVFCCQIRHCRGCALCADT
jgi:hypothetical protein